MSRPYFDIFHRTASGRYVALLPSPDGPTETPIPAALAEQWIADGFFYRTIPDMRDRYCDTFLSYAHLLPADPLTV